MAGMSVVVASTCAWERAGDGPPPPLQGEVTVGQGPDDDEKFEARFRPTTLPWPRDTSGERHLYSGTSLEECVAALNSGAAALANEGFSPQVGDERPQHLELAEVAPELSSARKLIADHLAKLPPQPPPPSSIIVTKREEIEDAVELLALPRGSLFAGVRKDQPVIFVTEASMTDWLEPGSRSDLEPDETKAFVFNNRKTRWTHIVRRGWASRRPGYLREEMRVRFELLVADSSPEKFGSAYAEAESAIQSLPCESCHQIDWPVIAFPARGSAEWWDDPSASYVCEHCGGFLGLLGESSRAYPFRLPREIAGRRLPSGRGCRG